MPQHTTSRGTTQPPPDQALPDQTPPEPDELLLISRAKAGEREAFALLVQRHGKAVLNLIDKMIRDRTIAEDLWQETFVRALENLATYEPRQGADGTGPSFASWLYRIAANLTLDELRRRGRWRMFSWSMLKPRRSDALEDEDMYDPPADTPDAPTLLESREDIQRVRRALDTLPPDWRMILILREYQDLPYEEIAGILRVPIGTVRSRLARAREQLRLALLQLTPRRALA
ncbi:MAG: sigma-70 family RNA polymerase sigma factor [Deltaproteobacteria bacterium]|nr:sigma-70 family RNA polymerase sigma factor [Deltaproteobacteria bacterium]